MVDFTKSFSLHMKRWMWWAGYRRCPCGTWDEKITKIMRVCPECNRKKTNHIYHNLGGKEKQLRWVSNNPEKAKAAHKRYVAKNKEKVAAWSKANYDRLKSTPEGLEKLRRYWKTAQANQKLK